MLIKSNLR